MAQETVVAKANGVYYAPVNQALPTVDSALSDAVWATASWTKIPEVTEDGIELEFVNESVKKRPLGTLMPTDKTPIDEGLASIKFATYRSEDAQMTLAFPDATHSGIVLEGGGSVLFYAMAVWTPNCVWHAKKVSATGNITMSYIHDYAKPPFEFECFEDEVNDPTGTTNWACHPIVA